MARCLYCNAPEADVDLGLCFECFCAERHVPTHVPMQERPTIEELCYPHPFHGFDGDGARCYCGERRIFVDVPRDEGVIQ